MSPCPWEALLPSVATDALGDAAYAAIEQHVESCPDCKFALEELAHRWVEGPLVLPCPERSPRIPGFEIQCELGRGGMGVVYLATEKGLDRLVALKVLPGAVGADTFSAARRRWLREARAVSSIRHPDDSATLLAGPRGTPCYMAPEQTAAAHAAIGPAADIYALGVILYELLTGRPPIEGRSVIETLDQVRGQEPVPPRWLNPAIPLDLDTLCRKCLEKEPSRRYASADALAVDLGRWLDGRPILARPVSSLEILCDRSDCRNCEDQIVPEFSCMAASVVFEWNNRTSGILDRQVRDFTSAKWRVSGEPTLIEFAVSEGTGRYGATQRA